MKKGHKTKEIIFIFHLLSCVYLHDSMYRKYIQV